ncbi:MAG: lysoplasmalogenase [Chitinophagaceae bacterium]|nr:lysoplasmalogenase [Chitinophagaceae bacterium]
MKKNTAIVWAILFILITIVNAAGIAAGSGNIHFVTKPLLIPALLLLLFFTHTTTGGKSIIMAGLFFSWLGDVLLLFENKHALFFIGGLASFLITHICYILYFLKIKSTQSSLLRKQPWIAALVAAYGVSLMMFLLPHLGDMKLPVALYAVVICNMVIFSLHVFTRLNKPANILFVAGALLFTASDSMLAINKFYMPFAGAGILIMLTYCAAQFLIVWGVINRKSLTVV